MRRDSLYDEIIHITVPVYSETNTFLNYIFNFQPKFLKPNQYKNGKNKVQ